MCSLKAPCKARTPTVMFVVASVMAILEDIETRISDLTTF